MDEAPYERNKQMIANCTTSDDDEIDQLAWQKAQKEVAADYASGPFPAGQYNLHKVCITPRFPKCEQKDDGTRVASNSTDCKRSGGNDTVHLCRRYCPEDLTHAGARVRWPKEAPPRGTTQGRRAVYNMEFRQDPKEPAQHNITLRAQHNPNTK